MRKIMMAGLVLLTGLVLVPNADSAARSPSKSQKFPCKVTGIATLDPIVNPDGSPSMHEHLFLGNTGVPKGVHTYSEAIASTGTCNFPGDTAAYWMPTLRTAAGVIVPAKGIVYYDRMTLQSITAFPADFGMIWGYTRGLFDPDQRSYYGWNCDNNEPLQPDFSKVDCRAYSSTSQVLTFRSFSPYCWDGITPAGRDYGAHVSYPIGYPKVQTCGAGMTVLPRIRVNFNYQTKYLPDGVLSSDMQFGTSAGASAHTDFWNTWNQPSLEALVAQLNA